MKPELRSAILLNLDVALEKAQGISISSASPSALRRLIYRVIRDERDRLGSTPYDDLFVTIAPDNINAVWIISRASLMPPKDHPSRKAPEDV